VLGYRFAASPGIMSVQLIVDESLLPMGAKSPVTRPGGGSSHAHDTNPEQSDRYGSHWGLLWRLHVDEHDVSPSGWPFGLWQYSSWAVTHCSALAITVERVTGLE